MEREFAEERTEEKEIRRRAEEALLRYIAERNARGDGKAAVEALAELHREMWESLKLKEMRDDAEGTCGEPLVEGPWQNMVELLKALREFL
jgi:hypothetical protein